MLIVLDVAIVVKEFSNWCAYVVSVGIELLVARVEVWLVVLVEVDVGDGGGVAYDESALLSSVQPAYPTTSSSPLADLFYWSEPSKNSQTSLWIYHVCPHCL